MATKKKQHFVPQFYMRNFAAKSDQNSISLYHFNSDRIIRRISLKDQNYGDYFYGKDLTIENALEQIEGPTSSIIARMLSDDTLPDRMSEDYAALLIFALFQSGRTRAAAAAMQEQVAKFLRELENDAPELSDSIRKFHDDFDNAPALTLNAITDVYPFMLDLDAKLLLNRSSRLFIASDHPVVQYNQFLEKRNVLGSNIGLAAKGLQMFLPLGPRHLLMMYDAGVYRVGGRRRFDSSIQVDERDVTGLNLLQAANADETLFFSPETADDHVNEAVREGQKFRLDEKVEISRYEAVGSRAGTLLQMSRVDLRVGLLLPSVGIIPMVAGSPISNAVVQIRDPEYIKLCRHFRSQVKAGRYKSSEFDAFMREQARQRTTYSW